MQPLLIDSHCHLDRLDDDPGSVLERARDAGVGTFLCVSINMENVREVIDIAHRYPDVFASVGVHPNEQHGREPELEELLALADDPEVVAIGETGLDYFHSKGDLEWQQQRFRRHIAAAKITGRPLIIHTRDAAEDTLKIMREEGAAEVGGVMHCFTGDWETAVSAMEMGFHISFSGIITFNSAAGLREVARRVPDDRLLVETDSPYLAPVPYRGKPNQPAYVREVAQCLAELRDSSLEHITQITTENFRTLFRIDQKSA
ncbi:MAG TPA: TatD family deoxyribonuclease [Gammaproteobacteria bacterium]|nr:TatD family deoxyribonuclease [Gammaproteobacteria bacterium]